MASHQKSAKNWQAEWDKAAAEYRKLAKRANQRMVRIERYAERPGYKALKNYAYKGAQRDIAALYPNQRKKSEKLRYTEKARLEKVERDGFEITGDEKIKANLSALRLKISSLEKFLGSSTSTIADVKNPVTGEVQKGFISSQDKRANTLNKRLQDIYGFDANLTADDLRRFFGSKKQKKLENLVGSDQMFIVMATMRNKGLKSNKKDLQKFFKNNINLKDIPDDISLDQKDYDNYKDYWDTLSEFVELTGNKMLDDFVSQAIKEGISIKNIFI